MTRKRHVITGAALLGVVTWIAVVYVAGKVGDQQPDASEENGAVFLWRAIDLFDRHTKAYVETYADSLGPRYADDPEMLLYDVQAADADEILLDYGLGLYEYYKSGTCFNLLEKYVVATNVAPVPLRRDESDNWIIDSKQPEIRWSAGEGTNSTFIASLGASIRVAALSGDHQTVMICLRTVMKSGDAGVELNGLIGRIVSAGKYHFGLQQVMILISNDPRSVAALIELDEMILQHQPNMRRLPRIHVVRDFVLAKALGTRVCIALETFRLENGRLPGSLDELPADTTFDWTKDPISNAPIGYIRLEEPDEHGRDYLVYTIGPDRHDNRALEHKSQDEVIRGKISGFDVIFNRPRSRIDD